MGSNLRVPSETVVDREAVESEEAKLADCAQVYGVDLLAYLLGAGADAPLATWRLDPAGVGAADRLRTCHRVSELFKDPRRARAWMRHGSGALGGRLPAWLVRSGDAELLARVEQAAEREADAA